MGGEEVGKWAMMEGGKKPWREAEGGESQASK
jgi:hypothetical protein